MCFATTPMYLLPHTPCSQGKQLGKFLAPIGLKLITYIFTNYPARNEFSWGANKFVYFRLFICTYITKPIYAWCKLRSSVNKVHTFSLQSNNVTDLIWQRRIVVVQWVPHMSLPAPLNCKTLFRLTFHWTLSEFQHYHKHHCSYYTLNTYFLIEWI